MTDDEIEECAYQAIERRDYDTARDLLTPLLDRDSASAFNAIGWLYRHGHPDQLNKELARQHFEKAIALGSADACFEMGWLLIEEDRLPEARAILEKGKEKGDADFDGALKAIAAREAEFLAIEAFESKDYRKAFELLAPHQEVDAEYTLTTLGWLHETELGGVSDLDLARSLYLRSAKIGSADAYYRIGWLEQKEGNDEAARAAFALGAAAANFPSMTRLGEMMVQGQGGPIDFDQGMSFLKRAADQGQIVARIELARAGIKAENNQLKRLWFRIKSSEIIIDIIKEFIRDKKSFNLFDFIYWIEGKRR